MLRKFRRGEKGFTLVELMIVIAIIGILAAIAIPQFSAYRAKGYMAATRADAKTAYTAMQAWIVDNPGAVFAGETINPSSAGVALSAARTSPGVTIVVAASGDVTATHTNLNGNYNMVAASGLVTDTLAPK